MRTRPSGAVSLSSFSTFVSFHGSTVLMCECYMSAWLFELAGGAIADFEGTCVPKSRREAAFTIAALHQWEMGIDDPRCVSSAEDVRRYSPPPSCPADHNSYYFPSLPQVASRDDEAGSMWRCISFGKLSSRDTVQRRVFSCVVDQFAVPRTTRGAHAGGRLLRRELGAARGTQEEV